MSQPSRPGSNPETQPAIVVYGDAIKEATPAERADIADRLANLLGAQAVVDSVPDPFVHEPSPRLPFVLPALRVDPPRPFSVLVNPSNKYRDLITAAQERAPGVITSEANLRRTLGALVRFKGNNPWFTVSHYDGPGPAISRVRAITFHDPDATMVQPALVTEDISNIAAGGAQALSELMIALVRPVEPSLAQSPGE